MKKRSKICNLIKLRLFQKKIPGMGKGGGGEGKMAIDIFFYGWLVQKVFKLYGSFVFDQI